MTKPAYDLSLGYNSIQSYKLFKIFEQPWMKYDINSPVILSTKSANISEPGCSNTRTQDIKHRANHSGAVLFLSIHTHKHRANHSSVILLESMSERADLPISVKLNS